MGILDAPGLSPRLIVKARGDALEVWGHSYPFGIGASDIGRRFTALVAQGLRLREHMDAVSGTTFTADSSGGSVVKFLQKRPRTGRGAVSGSGVTATGVRGFGAAPGVHLIMAGINDLNILGNTSGAMAPFKESLRVAVSRLRAGAVFEDSDATITTTGSWTTNADVTRNSGAGYKYTTSAAATYTITTPADFPGGTVAIGLQSQSNAGSPAGATHTASVNGGTGTAYVAVTSRSGSSTQWIFRIPGVPAGTNTIAVTLSNMNTLTVLDYWQWEVPDADAPLIILVKQPYPANYSAYGAVAPGPPTDAGVDVVNTMIDQVAAEFGSRVLTVNTSTLNGDSSMFAADALHPSDKGHRALAALVLNAVSAGGWTILAGGEFGPRTEYATAAPSDTRVYYLVGDQVINSAPVEAGSATAKYVTTGWVCTVEGRPGTWLPLRSLTGN